MSERSAAELKAACDTLDFRCHECNKRVFPGARLCIDCKYGPLPGGGDDEQ